MTPPTPSQIVPSPEAAIHSVGLSPATLVRDLSDEEWKAFSRLVGWEPGGPVVAPLPEEVAARQARQAWKQQHMSVTGRCLLLDDTALRHARGRLETCTEAGDFGRRLQARAQEVVALGSPQLQALIPPQAPWNTAGSFCPHCVGTQSVAAIHAPFWRWSVATPEQIQCPHCDIVYPHADYREEGRLRLPRLEIEYTYYLTPEEVARGGGRDGVAASRFGGGPTHVALAGEAQRCALNWILGQIEPLALAAALFEEEAWALIVGDLLQRLAQVFDRYPIYSYRQEYADCDPAFAVAHLNALPTPLKRAACRYTYCGTLGDAQGLHGLGSNTTSTCFMPNGEWGAARLAREKASHGQVLMALMQAYDLVRSWLPPDQCRTIEQDLLLEYYLDVEGLTQRIDNKSGPGAAARVACGVLFDQPDLVDAGVERFNAILHGQFYPDGSWRETPIYGAKALVEGLWQIPEILQGRRDLYAEGVLRRALEVYARVATPLGTQPSLDDSAVDFGLSPHLVDLARLRLNLNIPLAPADLAGLRMKAPPRRLGFAGYVPRWEMTTVDDEDRRGGDGGLGFVAVGHLTRPQPDHSWIQHLLGEGHAPDSERQPHHHLYRGRGLVCLGTGHGPAATQLYLDGGDGEDRHRHDAPLGLSLLSQGVEIFPDLGYIADHPANHWIRTTASHNCALVEGQPLKAAGRCLVHEFWIDTERSRAHVECRVIDADGNRRWGQRRLTLYPAVAPWPVALVDELMISGTGRIDHVMRVNADPHDTGSDHPWTAVPCPWELPGTPQQSHWREAGPLDGGARWFWSTSIGQVVAVTLERVEQVAAFRAPAWRTYAEIQAAPDAAWESVVQRQPVERPVRNLYLIGMQDAIEVAVDGDGGRIHLRHPASGDRRTMELDRWIG